MKLTIILLASLAVLSSIVMFSGPFKGIGRTKTASEQSPAAAQDSTVDMCCTAGEAGSKISTNSVYQFHSQWTDQNDNAIRFSALRGKIRVMAMFYSHCTYACPVTVNEMKSVQAALPSDLKKNVGFVLVTFDPKRDTPEVLRRLAWQQGLESSSWTLLTGNGYEDRTLAALLGVEFKKTGDGDFVHSNQIAVLDPEGEIVYRHGGLNESTDDIVEAVKDCAARSLGTAMDKQITQ